MPPSRSELREAIRRSPPGSPRWPGLQPLANLYGLQVADVWQICCEVAPAESAQFGPQNVVEPLKPVGDPEDEVSMAEAPAKVNLHGDTGKRKAIAVVLGIVLLVGFSCAAFLLGRASMTSGASSSVGQVPISQGSASASDEVRPGQDPGFEPTVQPAGLPETTDILQSVPLASPAANLDWAETTVRARIRAKADVNSVSLFRLDAGTKLLVVHPGSREEWAIVELANGYAFIKSNQIKITQSPSVQVSPNHESPVNPAPPIRQPPQMQLPNADPGGPRFYAGTGGGHWIDTVSGNGAVIQLEDGSTWSVSSQDQVDTSLWLPTTNITVLDGDPAGWYKLVNTEDGETAHAKYLGGE